MMETKWELTCKNAQPLWSLKIEQNEIIVQGRLFNPNIIDLL